jgi:hypothetical protein
VATPARNGSHSFNHREAIVAFDFFTVPIATFREYVCYYQEDRVHDSLSKDATSGRPIERRAVGGCGAIPRGAPPSVHLATGCIA